MKRRLQFLALGATALLALRMMAQEPTGGEAAPASSGNAGGAASSQTTDASSGATSTTGSGGSAPGGNSNEYMLPNGASSTSGTSTNGNLFGPGPGNGSTVSPGPSYPAPSTLFPGSNMPYPGGANPSASPAVTGSGAAGGQAGSAQQAPPVTLTLPGGYGGYGGSGPVSFTLGQGRLAKPPITFTSSVSVGYDDNINSVPSHITTVPTPTPIPTPTPPLEARQVGFVLLPIPRPIYQFFRAKALPTPLPSPTPAPSGVVGSAISTFNAGIQIQKGNPRTVITMDASGGASEYWSQPGGQLQYTGNFDLSLVHRLTERATLSIAVYATYQNSPNFALVNAPTSTAASQSYLNGSGKIDLSYTWGRRFSTITSISESPNILNSGAGNDLYSTTYGNQFRYTVSPRETVTGEVRQSLATYVTNSGADTSDTYFLLGIDSSLSPRLHNTFSAGVDTQAFTQSGAGQTVPYFDSTTTLAMPHGAGLSWNNHFGAQDSGTSTLQETSYRTSLGYAQPLSTKFSASVSVAYNYISAKDTATAASSYTQNQLQASLSLSYAFSPRFSLSLSYTYIDLLSSQINSSYTRDQIFLQGAYTFR